MPSWVGWSITILLLINSFGLTLVYFRLGRLTNPPPLSTDHQNQNMVLDKLSSIQDQLSRLQLPVLGSSTSLSSNQLSDLLPDISQTTTNTSNHFISISETANVDVYKEQADFSPIVGVLLAGQKYPFFAKLNNWYLVNSSGGQPGWVKAGSLIQEILP